VQVEFVYCKLIKCLYKKKYARLLSAGYNFPESDPFDQDWWNEFMDDTIWFIHEEFITLLLEKTEFMLSTTNHLISIGEVFMDCFTECVTNKAESEYLLGWDEWYIHTYF